MVAFNVEQIQAVTLDNPDILAGMDLMSPYVWRDNGVYRMLFRAVPNPQDARASTGLIYGGQSRDGLRFAVEDKPVLTPGPGPDDAGGCEDPTVLVDVKNRYLVFYTGVDAARRQGALLVAEGPSLRALQKQKVTLKAPPGAGNIKEATLAQTPDGQWRLFYEYAAHNASRVGAAGGPSPDGPWTILDDPFPVREDGWDNWHLSTGPIVTIEGYGPVMFYNGATVDARWRIGWVAFSPDFKQIVARGLEPLLVPPPPVRRAATDIAFAASAIAEDDGINLYYSLEDRTLHRARVRVYGAHAE